MIRTSRQLKALVRNMSRNDSAKALIIIRNYVIERFLERLSLGIWLWNPFESFPSLPQAPN